MAKNLSQKGERWKKIRQGKELMDYLAAREMTDIFERLIKNIKHFLSKIIGKGLFSFDEIEKVLVGIECKK